MKTGQILSSLTPEQVDRLEQLRTVFGNAMLEGLKAKLTPPSNGTFTDQERSDATVEAMAAVVGSASALGTLLYNFVVLTLSLDGSSTANVGEVIMRFSNFLLPALGEVQDTLTDRLAADTGRSREEVMAALALATQTLAGEPMSGPNGGTEGGGMSGVGGSGMVH